MHSLIWLLVFLALALALAWRPATLRTTLGVMGLSLFAFSVLGPEATLFKGLLWLLFAALSTALLLPSVRHDYLLRPAMNYARRRLPRLSPTEAQAMEAGTVGWEAELFSGRPDWYKLLSIRTPELSPGEQAFLDGPVETFCKLLKDWEISHELADLPPKAWDYLKQHRFFGLEIPTEYGGLGFSAGAHAAVLRKIASAPAGMTASSIVAVPNSLGPAALLLKYGTPEQQQRYLPALARGDDIPCFALTSPSAGSDAGAITDHGVVCRGRWQNEDIIGIRLNWDKRYISLAPVASLIGLAFQLSDPEGLVGDQPSLGMSCALIPARLPGIEIGKRHLPLNAPFMNGPVRGRDVFVPLDCLIGGLDLAGQGWRMLTQCLATGRAISLPAGSSGLLQGLARQSGAYARIREQFGRPIGEFEGVAEALGRIGGRTYAATALSRMTAAAVDTGERPSVASAIAKYHCTDLMRKAAADAMDIHAGKGVMLGPNNWLGRTWQAAPIHATVEGANILTRSMMIYGQGALRAHPYLLREIQALDKDDIAAFESLLGAHFGHLSRAASRAFVLALCDARLASAPAGPAAAHYRQLARYSAAFALVGDFCALSLGAELKLRESLSGRLADVLSWLYIASASLKQFAEDGARIEDAPLLDWVCAQAGVEIETALDGLIRHLPSRPLAWLARLLVFPLGRRQRPAADSTLWSIAQLLQTPGDARDRLTADAWVSTDPRRPTGRLERCLHSVVKNTSLWRRLRRAQRDGQLPLLAEDACIDAAESAGILSGPEALALREAQDLLGKVCAVDEFTSAALAHRKTPARPSRQRSTASATP